MTQVSDIARRAKAASQILKTLSGKCRADALDRMAGKLLACR